MNKSALHLLLLMCKKLLLRVGAKERDDIVPKVSKLKTLDDQLNAFKAILSSDFQPAIEKDAMFKFITKSMMKHLKAKQSYTPCRVKIHPRMVSYHLWEP